MTTLNLVKGGISVDDRGSVSYINGMDFSNVKRRYLVKNHRVGFVRAWHGHLKEGKFVTVINGSALIGAVNLNNNNINKFILSSISPSILYIPPGFANGFKTLEENTILEFFSTSTLEESLQDDIRIPWDKWNIWEEDFR